MRQFLDKRVIGAVIMFMVSLAQGSTAKGDFFKFLFY